MDLSQLIRVLEYAHQLLKECADNGHYPKSALLENGGYGFAPISRAISDLKKNDQNKKERREKTSASWLSRLFDHMANQHGLILTEGELGDIMDTCMRIQDYEAKGAQ